MKYFTIKRFFELVLFSLGTAVGNFVRTYLVIICMPMSEQLVDGLLHRISRNVYRSDFVLEGRGCNFTNYVISILLSGNMLSNR